MILIFFLQGGIDMKVKIEKLDNYGRGIAYLNEKIVFIVNALVGEEVEIELTKETKKYQEAKVTKYYKISPERQKSPCPYYDECGGCSILHFSIESEKNFKEEKIKSLFQKNCHLSLKILPIESKDSYYYRNKITLHVENNTLGYYENNTNRLIEIDRCLIANRKINSLLEPLKELVKNSSIDEILIRTSNDLEKCLVKLSGSISNYEKILKLVDVLIINDKVITPTSYIITNIKDKKYQLSSTSFFQVNGELTKYLYDAILEEVKTNSYENALDLYCGTGSITLYISDYIKKIIGIDYSESNINDANRNKLLNNSKNAQFVCAKVEDVITNYQDIDLIIVDPPRAGLKQKALKTIMEISPKTIIYVSCDVITLTRDINILKEKYAVEKIKPFNMFPRTYHVECLCILNLVEKYL